jgi:hypothetical protein
VTDDVIKNSAKPLAGVPHEAKTMVLTPTKEINLGPRLVLTTPSGESTIYPLNKPRMIIGRSTEADLNLMDPLVSRKHCLIEKRNGAFVVRNVSTTNPLFLNDRPVAEKRLYAGDQLKIGSATLAFLSDRKQDTKKPVAVAHKKKSSRGIWALVGMILILSCYLAFSQAYTPLTVAWKLKAASAQIKKGRLVPAKKNLTSLLNLDLSPEQTHEAMVLLAHTTMKITRQKAQQEDLASLVEYLRNYLTAYGSAKESEPLWDLLDYYRLALGRRLESAAKYQAALHQYAAIREDSIYFDEAHKAMRGIWLAHQQQSRQDQTLAQLLKEAEAHFQAQQYLKPVNQNAYALYQAVLALAPSHKLAIKRIAQMKAFYRQRGEGYFARKKWAKALSYFERYYLIDTDNAEINAKMKTCREKAAEVRWAARKSSTKNKKTSVRDEKREEIKRLLEESGAESSWIMQYLFEDQKGKNDSEKPW